LVARGPPPATIGHSPLRITAWTASRPPYARIFIGAHVNP